MTPPSSSKCGDKVAQLNRQSQALLWHERRESGDPHCADIGRGVETHTCNLPHSAEVRPTRLRSRNELTGKEPPHPTGDRSYRRDGKKSGAAGRVINIWRSLGPGPRPDRVFPRPGGSSCSGKHVDPPAQPDHQMKTEWIRRQRLPPTPPSQPAMSNEHLGGSIRTDPPSSIRPRSRRPV